MPGLSLAHDPAPDAARPEWKRDLLRRLAGLQQDTSRLMNEALAVGNIPLALQAVARAEKQIWLEWQIAEEPAAANNVNVAVGVTLPAVESPANALMERFREMNARRLLASAPAESAER